MNGEIAANAAAQVSWILANPARGRLLRDYARIRGEQLRARLKEGRRRHIRVGGLDVAYSHANALLAMFLEIFVLEEYRFATTRPDPVIIDAGANIGLATMYFKLRHPHAQIVAVEPVSASFNLLVRNLNANGFDDVRTVKNALVGRAGPAVIYASEGGLVSSLDPDRGGLDRAEVSTMTLSSLIETEVDLLKLDIEGAEFDVLTELVDARRLGLVREAVIEYHHHIGMREDRFGRFLAMLEADGFRYQLQAGRPPSQLKPGTFQDVLVHAYRC